MAASMLLRVFRCTRSLCCVGPCLVVLLLTYVPHAATACRMVSVDIAAEFQVVTLQGCDQEPRMLGYLLGNHTADMIQGRLAESAAAQRCRDFIATPQGAALFQKMKQQHAAAYPDVWKELQGTAEGARVALDEILLLNLRQELLAAAAAPAWVQEQEESCTDVGLRTQSAPSHKGGTTNPSSSSSSSSDNSGSSGRTRHNSKNGRPWQLMLRRLSSRRNMLQSLPRQHRHYQQQHHQQQQRQEEGHPDVLSPAQRSSGCGAGEVVLLGHNEDMSRDTLGRVFFVHHQGATRPTTWFAFVYAGELPSTGFGLNAAGAGFTLNALFPAAALLPGLGRNWVSRRLLEVGDMGAALRLVATPGQVVGHGYNLFHLPTCALVNVEVGPGGASSASALGPSSWYFHANMIKRLVVAQRPDNSSLHREQRALELQAPPDLPGVLSILGDTGDGLYPIYRAGTSPADAAVVTLCTAVMDVANGVLTVLAGNPMQQRVVLTLDVHTWRLALAPAPSSATLYTQQSSSGTSGSSSIARWPQFN